MLSGLTIFGYVVTVLVEAIARGVVAGAVVERRRRRLIERLEDHVINDDAIQAADERGDLYVVGNATNEGDLRTAGLERVLKPQVAAFLDAVSTPGGSELRFEEIEVDETCEPAGQESGEIGVRDRTGAVIVALRKSEGDFDATPSPDVRLEAGDHIIAVGTPDELRALEELFAPQEAVAR